MTTAPPRPVDPSPPARPNPSKSEELGGWTPPWHQPSPPRLRHPYAADRPSLAVVGGQRGIPATVRVRATVIADLMDELTAAGQEMVAAGMRVEYAIAADRPDVALHVAARLRDIGERYAHPGPESAA